VDRRRGDREPEEDPERSDRGARRHDDEPVAVVQHCAAPQLGGQVRSGEEALIDPVSRAIVEGPLLPLLGIDVLALGRVDDDKLRADTASLFEERGTLVGEEVAVEVGRDESVELSISEGKPTSRVRAWGSARSVSASCSTSSDQPGRLRLSKSPSPSHQSSYSDARRS
jgi:hypothetical protein